MASRAGRRTATASACSLSPIEASLHTPRRRGASSTCARGWRLSFATRAAASGARPLAHRGLAPDAAARVAKESLHPLAQVDEAPRRRGVWSEASMGERLQALAVAVRRPALDAMRESERRYQEQDAKRLYYLSMEFLMGRALGNNLTNFGLYDDAKSILAELGVDLEELEALEHD